MTPEQILQKTYDVLEERGWCQNTLLNGDGRVCLEGAFATACGYEPGKFWDSSRSSRINQAWYRLRKTVEAESGGRHHAPFTWNDQPGRTAEDVKLLLKKAAHHE